jgi:hypothetical protein
MPAKFSATKSIFQLPPEPTEKKSKTCVDSHVDIVEDPERLMMQPKKRRVKQVERTSSSQETTTHRTGVQNEMLPSGLDHQFSMEQSKSVESPALLLSSENKSAKKVSSCVIRLRLIFNSLHTCRHRRKEQSSRIYKCKQQTEMRTRP